MGDVTQGTTAPLVSIIIRARDEAPALRRLLPILKSQEVDFPFRDLAA
jgi:hypothetical protein